MSEPTKKEHKPFDKAFFDENPEKLPVIRITKAELDGFKSVEHGEIVFNCGKQFIPYGTSPDILGIYGQNGSGKTSFIQALSILRKTMRGGPVDESYSDCISVNNNDSTLKFLFELQYDSGEIRQVEYKFSIKKEELSKEEIERKIMETFADRKEENSSFSTLREMLKYRISIFNEVVKLSQTKNGQKKKSQIIISTADKCQPFGPSKKLRELIGTKKETRIKLAVYKEELASQPKSFIFDEKVLKELVGCGLAPAYYETLMALRYFARYRLFVIDTRPTGMIGLNIFLPVHTKNGLLMKDLWPEPISEKNYEKESKLFSNISTVLSQIVPGLSIKLKKLSPTLNAKGESAFSTILVANRNGTEIPLRDESDGIRKIISILSLITAAYNDPSLTIAIDEIDAGIFEYLLGEILSSFEETGKGQMIFTSHNLRPLEVINKKYLVFTTTNPNNRYYRFKDIALTNNLRTKYYREIVLGEQDEELYNMTKRSKIEMAMEKAYEEQ